MLQAELLVCFDYANGLFQYNAAYVRDGGKPNYAGGWESAGIFPSVHDALTEGKRWALDAKKAGFKRGAMSVPRVWAAAA